MLFICRGIENIGISVLKRRISSTQKKSNRTVKTENSVWFSRLGVHQVENTTSDLTVRVLAHKNLQQLRPDYEMTQGSHNDDITCSLEVELLLQNGA